MPFDDCRTCDRCWLVKLDGDYGSSFVLCEGDPGPTNAASFTEARSTPVTEIMTSKVISVAPDLSLEKLILLLIDNDINGVPVIDEVRQPIGMVSRSNLVTDDYTWAELRDAFLSHPGLATDERFEELFLPALFRSRCVADIMTHGVPRLLPNASVADAAVQIEKTPEHCALVVDNRNQLAGVVSKFDIVKWSATAAPRD